MFQKLLTFTKKVSNLADKPSGTAAEIKAQFDAAPDEVRTYLNSLIDALKSTATGDSGAKNLGATAITGLTGNDVQTLLESLNTNLGYQSIGIPHLHIEMNTDYFLSSGINVSLFQGNFLRKSMNGGWADNVNKWRVPVSGAYDIDAYLALEAVPVGTELKVIIQHWDSNGNPIWQYAIGEAVSASASRWTYASGSITPYLNQNDQISIMAFQDSGTDKYLKQGRLTAVLAGKY